MDKPMNEELYTEYNGAIGSLMAARRQYEEACKTHGKESWAAEQAKEYLEREIQHRDELRVRYDAESKKMGKRG